MENMFLAFHIQKVKGNLKGYPLLQKYFLAML